MIRNFQNNEIYHRLILDVAMHSKKEMVSRHFGNQFEVKEISNMTKLVRLACFV